MKDTPVDMLRNAIKDNPRASENELADIIWKRCNEKQRRAIFDYWFANAYRSFKVLVEEHRVAVLAHHREMRAEAKARRTAIKDKIKMALMDHLLSNGKLLRDATFADATREGGLLVDVGKLGKPNEIIGKKLSEHDIANIKSRNSRRRA